MDPSLEAPYKTQSEWTPQRAPFLQHTANGQTRLAFSIVQALWAPLVATSLGYYCNSQEASAQIQHDFGSSILTDLLNYPLFT